MSRGLSATGIVALALALALGGLACSEGDSGAGGLPTGSAGSPGSGNAGSSGAAGIAGGFGGANPTGAANATGTGNFVGSGAAGFSGAAGSSGSAGFSGAAGTSGSAATCIDGATLPPVEALITDFSDAVPDPASPGQFKFGGGTATRVQGGTSEFADTTETKATLAIANGALSVAASSKGSYTGVVLYMNGPACVDGSAYTGVQFDLSGSLGSCVLSFGFAFADDLSAASDSQRGICAATNCYGPSVVVTSMGTIKEPYTAVTGGSPDMGVDRQKLTGVQWQLQSPAAGTTCAANFTLDNVSFY
jgi:hypothetical protein